MPGIQPCLICRTTAYKDKFDVVYGMVFFNATGNYGSTVYDPVGGAIRNYLRVSICDKCIKEAATKGLIQEATVIPKPDKVSYKRWSYDEFEDD